MRKLDCLRCGSPMGFVMRERFQLGQTGLILGDLPKGKWRHLTEAEVRSLK